MPIEVEIKQTLSPEMQVVSDCFKFVRDCENDVSVKQATLKESKASLETAQGALNLAIEEMLNHGRQPTLFKGVDGELPVNVVVNGDGGGGQNDEPEHRGPRTVVADDTPVGGVLALGAAKVVDVDDVDHTTRYEMAIGIEMPDLDGEPLASQHVKQLAEQIAEFRGEQDFDKAGKPLWGKWWEFNVTLDDGSAVEVLYKPGWACEATVDDFEFWGAALNEAGYARWKQLWDDRGRPKTLPLSEYAREYAMKLAGEFAREQKSKTRGRRRTATAGA